MHFRIIIIPVKYHHFLLILLILFSSCNSFQKLLKSENVPAKYEKAKEYFNKKDYNKCILLLETILPYYRVSKEAEKIAYFYAFSEYAMGNYVSSSYHFKKLYDTYPFGEYAEEALYLYAYSLYEQSPPVDLDQTSSTNAIEALQLFISRYPNSKRVDEANKFMDILLLKIELKDFNTAKLYYQIQDYRAAAWSLKSFIERYPLSAKNKEVYFMILNSYYKLALNSIEEKKMERFTDVVSFYKDNKDNFKSTQYSLLAENIYHSSLNKLKKR